MSAPPSRSANGTTPAGYYPDPSIPGYIRYWDGAAWVPGTSRPEPRDGEPTPQPPPGVTPRTPPKEETGPVFFDEEPHTAPASAAPARPAPVPPAPAPAPPALALPAAIPPASNLPAPVSRTSPGPGSTSPGPGSTSATPGVAAVEPASAWQADAGRQGGFGGRDDRRVSWGSEAPPESVTDSGDPRGGWTRTAAGDAPAAARPAALGPATGRAPAGDASRRDPATGRNAARGDAGGSGERAAPGAAPAATGRPALPAGPTRSAPSGGPAQPVPPPRATPAAPSGPTSSASSDSVAAPATALPAASGRRTAPAAGSVPAAGSGAASPAAEPQAAGGGWAQQVRELADQAPGTAARSARAGGSSPSGRDPQPGRSARQAPGPQGGPVTPWKPPVDDPFLRALQTQARPAGLGRRLVARIIDSIVPVAAAAAVAVPLLPRAVDHIQAKVDAAEQAGVTREIWLLDTTTGGYLAVVLGTLLLTGVLYEALPTARWGRSLGKKLCGVKVLDLEAQTPPGVGAALLRWLLHAVLAVTAVGVVNAAWCLFDKPWRQCWHDKAARTFVAKDSGEALRPG